MPDHASTEEKSATETAQRAILEQLSKLAPPGQKALFEKLIAQSQFYFALTDQLQNNGLNKSKEASSKGWDILQTLFGGNAFLNQQAGISLTSSPELSRLLGLPDIDGVKKQAELFSDMAKEVEQLQNAQKKLASFFNQLNESALEQFNREKGETEDANALYSLWVECGEQAFAKVSQNEQYIESQAELLNALTGMDSLKKKVAQSALQQAGVASRDELKTVLRSLHELKREQRKKSRKQEQEIADLKKEVTSLKEKLSTKSSQNR